MLALLTLGALTLTFLATFWLTPIGVPTLRRMGNGKLSPDLTFHYGPTDTYSLLAVYGKAGVAHWRRMLLLDMIFPAVYGTFLALLAQKWAAWAEAGPLWWTIAVAFPVLSALADYVENILLLWVIAALPDKRPGVVSAASAFTGIKFAAFVAALLVPLVHSLRL